MNLEKGTVLKEITAVYKEGNVVPAIKIKGSLTASKALRKVYPVPVDMQESFLALYLNNSNITIGYSIISIGGITSTVVDPRIVMRNALLCGATSMIVAHNHPSGTLKPSREDKILTKKLKKAGKTLDIKILDHIILTNENHYSFFDENQMP
jgi:DNA repair protein RadC